MLRRSKGGHADSNRTLEAAYKKGAGVTAVDVSALDGVIALDEHVEPSVRWPASPSRAGGCLSCPSSRASPRISGGGIESTSHRPGSVLDTVAEIGAITDGTFPAGNLGRPPDLFAAAATGFGLLGVITRLALRIERAPRFVTVSYLHLAAVAAATPSKCR